MVILKVHYPLANNAFMKQYVINNNKNNKRVKQ